MSIPTTAAPLPSAPTNEGDASVSFSSGGHQTWNKEAVIADNIYPLTIRSWKRVLSTFPGRAPKEQFVYLCSVDGREADGELAYYTGTKITGHPKEKLTPFLRDVLKLPLPTPENPRLPDPVGAKLRGLVKSEPSTSNPAVRYPKIKEVMAAV